MMPTDRSRESATVGRLQRALTQACLACGVLYAVTWIVANDVIAASMQPGYSRLDQAVSELSATGAPAAGFLRATLPVFTALILAFGTGVWRAAGEDRRLRVVSVLIFASAAVGLAWLWFPMSSRADMGPGPMPANDAGHLVLSALTVTLILSRMGFGSAAFGTRFRVFTAVCVVALLGFGVWMGALTPGVAAGEPTPWMGFAERAMLAAWLAWDSVFALGLIARLQRPERVSLPDARQKLSR